MSSDEIKYGNLRQPKLPGLLNLGAIPSMILVLGAFVMMMLIFIANIWVAAIWVVLVVAVVVPEAIPTSDGSGRYATMLNRWRFNRARKKNKHVLVQGLTGLVPDGTCHLPGVAASVKVSSHRDVHGREFGLIEWTTTDLYAVVIQCFPPGFSGLDKQVIDHQVAQWAAWMGQLNTVGEVAGASAVIETAPDSGQRLARAVEAGRAEDAPPYSRQLAHEMKQAGMGGAPVVAVRITVTFDAKLKNSDGAMTTRTRDEMASIIGDVLPTLTGTLVGTGAGSSPYPCSAQEIIDDTRVAYDPGVAPLVEKAQAEGGTMLTWDQVGPATAVNHFSAYQHETAWSKTWQMRQAPTGVVVSRTLQSLLAPHRDVARKRVTLLYRPEPAARSAQIAENDVTIAQLRASQSPRSRAAHELALLAARKTAEQEAAGSPLVRVGLLVTVTVMEYDDLERATRLIERTLTPQARLAMRLPHGAQDSAFVAGLPLGMVPHHHTGLAGFVEGV